MLVVLPFLWTDKSLYICKERKEGMYFHYDQPLGLPRGSVRAILSMLIVIGALAALFLKDQETARVLVPLVSLIVGFYFGRRSVE